MRSANGFTHCKPDSRIVPRYLPNSWTTRAWPGATGVRPRSITKPGDEAKDAEHYHRLRDAATVVTGLHRQRHPRRQQDGAQHQHPPARQEPRRTLFIDARADERNGGPRQDGGPLLERCYLTYSVTVDVSEDTVDGMDDWRERARGSIAKSVSRLQRHTSPTLLVAGLVAAALLPAVLPVLSGVALAKTLEAIFGRLQSIGSGRIDDAINRFIDNCGATSEEEVQEQLEEAVVESLDGPGGAEFRAEAAELLKLTGAVEAALSAAPADDKAKLAQRFTNLAFEFGEFAFVVDEVLATLRQVFERQSEQLALQREQLDLQRDQTSKVSYLISVVRRGMARTVPADGTPEQAGQLPGLDEARCPYRGLAPFRTEDAALFFGRERLVAELITRLYEQSVLLLTGPSGSGKSSVLRAGLLPRLAAQSTQRETQWLLMSPGPHPVESLAYRIAVRCNRDPVDLLHQIERDPQSGQNRIQFDAGKRPGEYVPGYRY